MALQTLENWDNLKIHFLESPISEGPGLLLSFLSILITKACSSLTSPSSCPSLAEGNGIFWVFESSPQIQVSFLWIQTSLQCSLIIPSSTVSVLPFPPSHTQRPKRPSIGRTAQTCLLMFPPCGDSHISEPPRHKRADHTGIRQLPSFSLRFAAKPLPPWT